MNRGHRRPRAGNFRLVRLCSCDFNYSKNEHTFLLKLNRCPIICGDLRVQINLQLPVKSPWWSFQLQLWVKTEQNENPIWRGSREHWAFGLASFLPLLSATVSLSLTHTHKHTHTLTHTQYLRHLLLSLSLSFSLSISLSHAHAHKHTHTHT